MTNGELSGWNTIGGYVLNCTDPGLYEVSWGVYGSLNNNDIVIYQVMVNNTPDTKGGLTYRYSNGLAAFVSKTYNRRFGLGDRIYLQHEDTTRAGASYTFNSVELNVNKIGN